MNSFTHYISIIHTHILDTTEIKVVNSISTLVPHVNRFPTWGYGVRHASLAAAALGLLVLIHQ